MISSNSLKNDEQFLTGKRRSTVRNAILGTRKQRNWSHSETNSTPKYVNDSIVGPAKASPRADESSRTQRKASETKLARRSLRFETSSVQISPRRSLQIVDHVVDERPITLQSLQREFSRLEREFERGEHTGKNEGKVMKRLKDLNAKIRQMKKDQASSDTASSENEELNAARKEHDDAHDAVQKRCCCRKHTT